MKFSDLKYLSAYLIPIMAFVAIFYDGLYSWSGVLFAFFLIPLIEFFVVRSPINLSNEEQAIKKESLFFDLLLYLNIPILYLIIYFYLGVVNGNELALSDYVGKTLSVGILLGACINVAHELGHKNKWYQQLSAKILLLPSMYMHFIIEHNRGHHLKVATPDDPATSRKGESVYFFWLRSSILSYIDAWKLESNRLQKLNKSSLSIGNEMIIFQITQVLYLLVIYNIYGIQGVLFSLFIAVTGFLLLETINYIEHYGLVREVKPNGRYEKVDMRHSWNSNHEFGRIVLYELTRHSDHHYKANRKYQLLRHHDESPQLPLGYPGSMLLSFVPPLWFYFMDKELENIKA